MSACAEGETIWSHIFPGARHTVTCLQPAVENTEITLDLDEAQRRRTVWRLDGGAGSDENLRWLLARDYQVLAKGLSGLRAAALARQVTRWDAYAPDKWLGEVAPPVDYGRPVRVFVLRKRKGERLHYSYYVSTLTFSSKKAYLAHYEARGGAEVEQFRDDKDGLHMEARRKRSFTGQAGYILLTDLAHNLLTDFARRGLADSALAELGSKRIVRDLLTFPGRVTWGENELRVDLLSQKQFSQELVMCLLRYLAEPLSGR